VREGRPRIGQLVQMTRWTPRRGVGLPPGLEQTPVTQADEDRVERAGAQPNLQPELVAIPPTGRVISKGGQDRDRLGRGSPGTGHSVTLSTGDPARRALVGHSLGAVAALHLATQRPDLFGSVVAGSAALWWPGENGQLCGADVAAAYRNTRRIGRLFLDVGTEEADLLTDARTFHDALVTAGHDLTYREFRGGHDHACWRGTVADGIVDVLSKASGQDALLERHPPSGNAPGPIRQPNDLTSRP